MKASSRTGVMLMGGAIALLGRHPAGADERDHSAACPMHAAATSASPAPASPHHAGVDARHDEATGVSHAASVHHFTLDPQGGRIRLEVTDEADAAGRDRVRAHLAHVAREFARGRFDLPMLIHDRVPPGVETMRRLRAAIRYEYAPTARGGRVDMTSASPEAQDAIHAFLRFQIEDHRTGDPLEVAPRP
jgi:hypothetical protein